MSRRNSFPSPSSSARKKSRDKLFHLVLHDNEERTSSSLRRMRRKGLMASVAVPGSLNKDSTPYDLETRELNNRGRNLINGTKKLVRLMHLKGLTLDGNFSVKNLVWVSITRQVKFREIQEENFVAYTKHGAELDYRTVATAVEHLLDGEILPCDLKDWIDLLKTDPVENQYLVDFHIALKSPVAKIKHFVHLYGLLEQLKLCADQGDKPSRVKYESVVSFKSIRAADNLNTSWKANAHFNTYLLAVYNYKRKEYKSGLQDASALLKFVRHCTQHLIQYSVEAKKVVFRYHQFHVMIESVIPGIFHEFQIAMSACGIEVRDDS